MTIFKDAALYRSNKRVLSSKGAPDIKEPATYTGATTGALRTGDRGAIINGRFFHPYKGGHPSVINSDDFKLD